METLLLIYICTTAAILIIFEICLNKIKKAYRELSSLYDEEKEKNKVLLNEYWKEHKRIF